MTDIPSAPLSPKEVVLGYIAAVAALDFPRARAFFVESGFEYIGPNMHFADPDALLTFQFGMGPIQKAVDVRRVIVDGGQVCVLADYKTYFEAIGDVRVALWAEVCEGKIRRMEVFYNAAVVENMLAVDSDNPMFAAFSGKPAGQT